jgi:hypothetical protein
LSPHIGKTDDDEKIGTLRREQWEWLKEVTAEKTAPREGETKQSSEEEMAVRL